MSVRNRAKTQPITKERHLQLQAVWILCQKCDILSQSTPHQIWVMMRNKIKTFFLAPVYWLFSGIWFHIEIREAYLLCWILKCPSNGVCASLLPHWVSNKENVCWKPELWIHHQESLLNFHLYAYLLHCYWQKKISVIIQHCRRS